MRYSIDPRKRIYVKGYGFMSFARNFSDKYSKSLIDKGIDVSKTFAKTASKRILKKSAEATGDLIGNKFAKDIDIVMPMYNLIEVYGNIIEMNQMIT